MPFIRTVLGDIPSDQLGVCYAHEHIIIDPSFTTKQFPAFLLDSVEKAAAELTDFHRAGGRAMVDSMPIGGGRNVIKLAEISRRTGVHIVCPTGLHLKKYYPPEHWSEQLSASELSERFIAEIEQGIDANDYNGPDVQRTPHRAGLIKIASGLDRIDAHQAKIFEAAAIAHGRTGCPILTHTEQGTAAIEQVKMLSKLGVLPAHVVLSHTDRKPDVIFHRDLLATGVLVEFDSAFRWKEGKSNPTRDLILSLFADGLGNQIMLGMDAARSSYWRHYGGKPGLTFLLETFVPQLLAAGLSPEDVGAIFVENPARAYSMR